MFRIGLYDEPFRLCHVSWPPTWTVRHINCNVSVADKREIKSSANKGRAFACLDLVRNVPSISEGDIAHLRLKFIRGVPNVALQGHVVNRKYPAIVNAERSGKSIGRIQ